MRAKQSKENERAFSRPSFLLFDSEWFFNRSRRSYYMNSYYLYGGALSPKNELEGGALSPWKTPQYHWDLWITLSAEIV